MSSNPENIVQFIQHFRMQEATISSVESLLFRKILYVTALDTIGRAAFGSEMTHRSRFSRVIMELANWEFSDRVSLPQLRLSLRQTSKRDTPLSIEINQRLKNLPYGKIISIVDSPTIDELLVLAHSSEEKCLLACSYVNLFYDYRNSLVHEFREPGNGIELSTDLIRPYYHGMIGDSLQLVFPVGLFALIYDQSLTGLKNLLDHSDVDPFTQFKFSSDWGGPLAIQR